MTTIWNKCSAIMPPDNNELIIAKTEAGRYQVGTGSMLRALFGHIRNNRMRVDPSWRWTEYSDELWLLLKPR